MHYRLYESAGYLGPHTAFADSLDFDALRQWAVSHNKWKGARRRGGVTVCIRAAAASTQADLASALRHKTERWLDENGPHAKLPPELVAELQRLRESAERTIPTTDPRTEDDR
jgi:hypothetical protein